MIEKGGPPEDFALDQNEARGARSFVAPDLKVNATRLEYVQIVSGIADVVQNACAFILFAARNLVESLQRFVRDTGEQIGDLQRACSHYEYLTFFDLDFVALERRLSQSPRLTRSDVPLPQMLMTGQQRSVVKPLAEADILVRTGALIRVVAIPSIRDQHLQITRDFVSLHSIGRNIAGLAYMYFAHRGISLAKFVVANVVGRYLGLKQHTNRCIHGRGWSCQIRSDILIAALHVTPRHFMHETLFERQLRVVRDC